MNREKITILFVINTNKTNQKGLCPLSCRIIHSANTINKIIQRLRTPIKKAISEGYLDREPLILYKSKKVHKEVIFHRKMKLIYQDTK